MKILFERGGGDLLLRKKALDGENATQTADSDIYRQKSKKWINAITAIVVVAVIVINAIISLVGDGQMWYVDMTDVRYTSGKSTLYTLSDECRNLVEDEAVTLINKVNAERAARNEEKIKLKIVFCSDKDAIENDGMMAYVSYTARALAKEYPDAIEVEYINIEKNPSAVQKYKTTSAATIYDSDVIVEFGSEYLIGKISTFYYQDSTASAPWAYNGEQRLASMILALTQAESPICALTSNHGETLFDRNGEIKPEYTEFVKLVGGAGYEVKVIDLEREDIPENCRMIITFDPQSDFKAYGSLGENGVSEIEKLDKYLDGTNAFFYVCDRETPKHPNIEDYLEDWGVCVKRAEDGDESGNYAVKDAANCTDSGKGDVVVGNYVTFGLGGTITSDLRKSAYPAKVVFGSPTAIAPSDSYIRTWTKESEEENAPTYSYYNYYRNGINRNMLDVFTSYPTAKAEVGGEVVEVATEQSMFRLMTITQEERQVQESNYTSVNQASYVIALASTDFVRNDVLTSSAYGNTDVILSALRNTSTEVVPTNVELKAFYIYDITDEDVYARSGVEVWFICLVAVPAAVALVVGTVINVRRRYK